MLIPIIMVLVSLAIFLVLRRASRDDEMQQEFYYQQEQYIGNDDVNAADGTDGATTDDDFYVDWDHIDGIDSFHFLARYSVELLLAWFFYFPVIGTILFSGILGCGRLPILGGRPRDVRLVEADSREYRRF